MGANDGGEASDSREAVALVLYVQRPVAGPRTEAIDRLSELDADWAIESFDVTTVPGEILVSQGAGGRTADIPGDLDILAAWRAPGLRSTFGIEETQTRMGRTVRTFSPPEMILGVYAGAEPFCVFPCTDGEHTWTVTDFLDSYEATGEPPAGVDIALPTT